MTAADFGLFFESGVTLTAPLVLAALGGLTSERAGVMNIALEGNMLMATCVTALVGFATGSAWLGMAAGVGAATAFSLLHALLTQVYRLDHIISGMGINALAWGLTAVLGKVAFDPDHTGKMPSLPMAGYWIASLACVAVIGWMIVRTRVGLHLLAVGNSPSKARQMGLQPAKIRFGALALTGLFCGLAGALIVSNAGSFTENMTGGRGFIALAALILGGWRPWPTLAACLLFGFFQALQLQLQGTPILGADIPSEVWNSLPYLVTLVALAGLLGRNRAPAGLGEP